MTSPMRINPTPKFLRNNPLLYAIPLPLVVYLATSSSRMSSTMSNSNPPSNRSTFPARPFRSRHQAFPYSPDDFKREDESQDQDFYSTPRFVTHIDDHAIAVLKQYYASVLPRKGRILDLCSSWISHFPQELEEKARSFTTKGDGATVVAAAAAAGMGKTEKLEVIGLGMNKKELDANPILSQRLLQDLNARPQIPDNLGPLDVTVCVVSIDYLTSPVAVLSSIRNATRMGGKVHLVISNRCFPTKAVGRWLRVGEQERLNMVGEYLWWSGWREVKVVELCDGNLTTEEQERAEAAGGLKGGMAELMKTLGYGSGRVDPLWVVRGVKTEEEA